MKKFLISFFLFFVLFIAIIFSLTMPYTKVANESNDMMQLCKKEEDNIITFAETLFVDSNLKAGRNYKLIVRNGKVILQVFKKLTEIVDKEKDVSEEYLKFWNDNDWLRNDTEVYICKFAASEYMEAGNSMMLKYCFSSKIYNSKRILRIYYGDRDSFPEVSNVSFIGDGLNPLTASKKLYYAYDTYWF